MKGMVLAAGYGTRLWPLTEDRTKPAVPFLGKPVVVYVVEYLRDHGIRDIMVNLHHRPESVVHALGDGSALGVRISYSHEKEILGTGGALDKVRDWFSDDDFVVANGKVITDLDLAGAIAAHQARRAIATLLLKPNKLRERFTIVEVAGDCSITGFAGYPDPSARAGEPPPLMFTGIQVLSPRVLDFIPKGAFSHTTTNAFPDAWSAGELVLGFECEGEWRELSTLERYLGESIIELRRRGIPYFKGDGPTSTTQGDGPTTILDSVLWDNVAVGDGSSVIRCVLGDGVVIPSGAKFENSVIVRAEIATRIERGWVQGDNLVVPLGRVLD